MATSLTDKHNAIRIATRGGRLIPLDRIRNSRKEFDSVQGAVYFYPGKQSSLPGDTVLKMALLRINSAFTNS
jgi:hypothetical protein